MKSSSLGLIVPTGWRLLLVLLLAWTLSSPAPAQAPPQGQNLVPQKTDKGILFQCLAPKATTVYLAGDFNNWADNTNSVISDPAAKMTGPDSKGVWQITVSLSPGDHAFKFCINGAPGGWFAPDWAPDRDGDGNAIIHVTSDGVPELGKQAGDKAVDNDKAVNGDWQPQQKDGMVTFQFYSPTAQSVYLAGDFNNWAGNNNGQASDAKCLMKKSSDGVWRITVPVPTGRHAYQFVVDGNKWQPDPNESGKDDQNHSVIDVK